MTAVLMSTALARAEQGRAADRGGLTAAHTTAIPHTAHREETDTIHSSSHSFTFTQPTNDHHQR